MLRQLPLIVALDGPSDTGKSTLAAALSNSLHSKVLVLPCYAELASAKPPRARADDRDEQMRGLEYYVALDGQRREMAAEAGHDAVVIADRSWLGLLGHTYAIEQTGGPNVYQQATALLQRRADELLRPDMVLFLALDDHGRRSRAAATDEGAWFTDEHLNEQINQFFRTDAPKIIPGAVHEIDASPAAAEVLASAEQVILARRESKP